MCSRFLRGHGFHRIHMQVVVSVVEEAVVSEVIEVDEAEVDLVAVEVIEVDEAEEDSEMSTVLQFLPIREELWPMPVQQRRRSLTERL